MLNISKNRVYREIVDKDYSTLTRVELKRSSKVLRRIIIASSLIIFFVLFLPWTQNIRTSGYVSTLKPDQKPQKINSIIGGRIESWFIQEGDYVTKGDTLIKISEIKDAYFDNNLLERTKNQVELKKQSVINYSDKVKAQENQLNILEGIRNLKLSQAQNKISQALLKLQSDSISYQTAKLNYGIVQAQYIRTDSLYRQGLKSKVDLEEKKNKKQQGESYQLEAQNKWSVSQNELINLRIEIDNIKTTYETNLNKLQSDILSTMSQKIDIESDLNKLENIYSNYLYRNGLYFITAPQSGYITKMYSFGIGETIKEGQEILSLMPLNYDLAVEMYVDPIDLPLIKLKERVYIQFDGWPAIVFSGWPNISRGTYHGTIYAIDQFIGENGKYRVLVQPDATSDQWPEALRFGSGTSSFIMFNDVPIWYELWRQINGFPPDYYSPKIKETIKK